MRSYFCVSFLESAQSAPPPLHIELPPDIGRTFVASVTENKSLKDPTKFFAKIVEGLEKKSHTGFRNMMEEVRRDLEDELVIDFIDQLEEDLILPHLEVHPEIEKLASTSRGATAEFQSKSPNQKAHAEEVKFIINRNRATS